jgi:hypothetical protein
MSRVLRLPGLFHRKGEPFRTRIVSTCKMAPYTAADFGTAVIIDAANVFERKRGTDRLPRTPSQELNDAAMANFPAWVPELFPKATRYKDGYRVSSKDLDRELDEDLSIVSIGIKDWGVHDLGDRRSNPGGRSPIDLVMEWGKMEFGAASDWLRERVLPKQNEPSQPKTRLMQTSGEFVAGYVPPDYLIDGLLQRRYVYSFTAPTGSGKTAIALLIALLVALGMALAGREVERGRVLFFAGENPDDVRSRWIKLCEAMDQDPDTLDVVFMPFTPKLSEAKIRKRIDEEAAEHGSFSLLIVDTSASYYSGDDENDNVALGTPACCAPSSIFQVARPSS